MLFTKSIIFSAALLLGFTEHNVTGAGDFWQIDYVESVAQAKKENKVIMLYFSGSDWCKPCIIWKKEVFDTDTFQQFANENIVPVKLDFPRLKKNKLPESQLKQNESLAAKYNNEGVFPMVVFVDANGAVLEKSAYRAGGPDEFIEYVESILAKNN
jgi:thioredoxin-related protein